LFATSAAAFLKCGLAINVIWVISEDKTCTLENETVLLHQQDNIQLTNNSAAKVI